MHNIRTLVRGVQYAYYELVESIMHNKYELEYSCMYEKYNILCIARSMHSMHIPPYISYTLANRTLVLASSYSLVLVVIHPGLVDSFSFLRPFSSTLDLDVSTILLIPHTTIRPP